MVKKLVHHYVYDTNDVLGAGMFGTVYKGRYIFSEQKVALKVLNKKFIDKDDYMKSSLTLEIKTLKKITSNHIVGFRDVMCTSHNYYIVQEYCNQGDFEALLKKRGKIPEQEAIEYMIQILRGFYDIVSRGYIHRDFKPQNILINNGVLKIADFGLARTSNQDEFLRSQVGTPMYESPQTLKGQSYNYKCDIWAIGLVFYEMLYGKLPWNCGNAGKMEYIKQIQSVSLSFPSEVQVSEEMKTLLGKCLKIQEQVRSQWSQIFGNSLFRNRKNKIPQFLVNDQKFAYAVQQINRQLVQKEQSLQELFDSFLKKQIGGGSDQQPRMSRKNFQNMLKVIAPEIHSGVHIDFILSKFDRNKDDIITLKQFTLTIKEQQERLIQSLNNNQMKTVMLRWIREHQQQLETKRQQTWQKLSVQLSEKFRQKQLNQMLLFNKFNGGTMNNLNRQKFIEMLKYIDQQLSVEECIFLFKEFDTNGDGIIQIKQFFNHMDRMIRNDDS